MPRGNRSIIAAFGLGLGVLLAFVVAYNLYNSASTKQAEHEATAKNRADGYAHRANVVIRERCNPLAGSEKADCIAKEEETARQGYRDEYDLEAQRVTATWTGHMGIAAIIGMAASLVGVGLVWFTFSETRKANEIARQSSVDQNRGWLIVETIETELFFKVSSSKIEIVGTIWFVVKNTGRSACSEIWTSCAVGNHQGIWSTLFESSESPLANECLPPDGTTRVGEDVYIEIPVVEGGTAITPQAACIAISYNGGGLNRFATECIWTLSSWSDNSDLGWNSRDFANYVGNRIQLNAYPHFGYFRTVT